MLRYKGLVLLVVLLCITGCSEKGQPAETVQKVDTQHVLYKHFLAAYKDKKPLLTGANDINNDGREDLIVIYQDTSVTNKGRTISWNLVMDELKNQLEVMQKYGVQNDVNTVKVEDYVNTSYIEACGAQDFNAFIKEKVDPVFPLKMSYEDWKAKAKEVDNVKADVKG